MKQEIEVKSADSVGDIFVKGVGRYLKNAIASDTLRQLVKNYESAFGETPDNEQLQAALTFVESFLCEIGETAAGTQYARAATSLSWFIITDDVLETSERIAEIRTKPIFGKRIPLSRLKTGDHFVLANNKSLEERYIVEKNKDTNWCPLVNSDKKEEEEKEFFPNTIEVIKLD